ncbi:MAG: ParB/RepB/Spo0J family partition protein [Rickettsiales bacterium]|jgi:ParB family chromosome partitioning protein|nr:ParB/RepB/Spo0J family partition protein [Rickettsiales bacterium]
MGQNKKLARGLSSLLGEKNLSLVNIRGEVPLGDIVANNAQPRRNFEEEELEGLAKSIEKYGVLQPILVRRLGTKYEIIAGERRHRAAKMAGLETIPVIIKDFDQKELFCLSVIENVQRKNLNPLEEAAAYKHLIESFGYSQQDLSDVIGKSRSHIANLLRLLQLPESVQKHIINGELEMGHARALVGCASPEEMAEKIIEENLSVRDTENLLRKNSSKPQKFRGKLNVPLAKSMAARTDQLAGKINLDCRINYNEENHSGTIAIRFYSLEELDNFIDRV